MLPKYTIMTLAASNGKVWGVKASGTGQLGQGTASEFFAEPVAGSSGLYLSSDHQIVTQQFSSMSS